MTEKALVVFTYRPGQEIILEGGSQAWALSAKNARRCTYLICTRNRDFNEADPADRAAAQEKHGAAFLIGKITAVDPAPEWPERFIVRFSEYALLETQPIVWRGARNPVWYVEDIKDLGINPDELDWQTIPPNLGEDEEEGVATDAYFEKFAGPLGHVILEFNYLEVDAGRMIARLLQQNDVVAAVFAGAISFLDKLKLIQMLVVTKVHDAAMRREFDAIVREATELNIKRNRYVHAEYMPIVGPNDELVKMLHRRLKDSGKGIDGSKGQSIDDLLQPVDEKALVALSADIHRLAYRMRALAEKYVDWFPGRS